jgi:hypothetical protein
MFLEAWKTSSTLLALLRVVVEPCNGRPCPFSRRLTRHRIELVRPRELLGKNSTISTQFILPDPAVIHPVSDARVSDETGSTNSFIKLLVLLVASLKFCLKYKHGYADTSIVILTPNSEQMEGLYIKVEEEGVVKARYKFVRASFLTAIKNAEGHWLNRPIVTNILRPGVDLFSLSL